MTRYDAIVEFPKMKVAVRTRDERVAEICYLPPSVATRTASNALAERAARQLAAYRDDPNTVFDLPLLIEGTEFQRRLWDALCEIPRGKTLSYGELARRLGVDARAIGQACGDVEVCLPEEFPDIGWSRPTASAASRTGRVAISSRRSAGCLRTNAARTRSS